MPNQNHRSHVTTHVLDTVSGKAALGISVSLEKHRDGKWHEIASGATNADGRIESLLKPSERQEPGLYRLRFATGPYLHQHHGKCFYPEVVVAFEIAGVSEHYHVPLLLGPWSYTTYRGT